MLDKSKPIIRCKNSKRNLESKDDKWSKDDPIIEKEYKLAKHLRKVLSLD